MFFRCFNGCMKRLGWKGAAATVGSTVSHDSNHLVLALLAEEVTMWCEYPCL